MLNDLGVQAKGESPPCFVASLVETEQRHELTEKEAAWLAGIMLCVLTCLCAAFLTALSASPALRAQKR